MGIFFIYQLKLSFVFFWSKGINKPAHFPNYMFVYSYMYH